jgi:hypothetical protein
MPQNKRESLIYTVMMCFLMVLWMSIYNVSIHMNGLSVESVKAAWLGFPLAYVVAMCCDWFIVSGVAKKIAFGYLLKPDSSIVRKVITVSSCMVVPMVILMSLYGAIELCIQTNAWNRILLIWLTNIPLNFIMALPFQLIVAGPIVRLAFRKVFPIGKVLA